MILSRVAEIEAYLRDKATGRVKAGEDYPHRTHTGTWRGRALKDEEGK